MTGITDKDMIRKPDTGYSPPRVMRMGDLQEGIGSCAPGSSDNRCENGAIAGGWCTDGSVANVFPGYCTIGTTGGI